MTILIFVRHGKALTNQLGILNNQDEGFPLTDEGRTAVARTAIELKKIKIAHLYSSNILRARQTAEIIGKAVGAKPTIDRRLKDREFGEMLNMPVKDGEWLFDVDWDNTSVETAGSIEKRMASFIDMASGKGGVVVAVSHEDEIKSAVLMILGLNYRDFSFGIKITNARMTVVSATGKRNQLLAVNYTVLTGWLVSQIKKAASVPRANKPTRA